MVAKKKTKSFNWEMHSLPHERQCRMKRSMVDFPFKGLVVSIQSLVAITDVNNITRAYFTVEDVLNH